MCRWRRPGSPIYGDAPIANPNISVRESSLGTKGIKNAARLNKAQAADHQPREGESKIPIKVSPDVSP